MIIAVTGIRDLSVDSESSVELAVVEAASRATEMRFGGAIGSDTVALNAACGRTRCVVIVPKRVIDQPKSAQCVIRKCANYIKELRRADFPHASSYFARNEMLLDGADELLAFTDGFAAGGTWWTIQRALSFGISVQTIHVERTAC